MVLCDAHTVHKYLGDCRQLVGQDTDNQQVGLSTFFNGPVVPINAGSPRRVFGHLIHHLRHTLALLSHLKYRM